jgi:uncharacterized protein
MIQAFFETKKIAVAGVSRNEKKFGTAVFKELREKGYEVIPINPNTDTILGVPCYRSVAALPAGIDSILLATPKQQTMETLKEAVAKGIKNIWIQQFSETPETLAYVKASNLNPVMKQCVLMFAEPAKSFHKFHRSIKGFFGLLPK